MEEKDEKKFSIDTENLKSETVETAKMVKDSMKGTNIKEETTATKGFILEIFKNPIEKIKEVANDNSAKYFKTAIVLIIVWIIAVFINSSYSTIYLWGFSRVWGNILTVLKKILTPAIGIIVYSLIVLILNSKNKKSLSTVLSTITVTQIPLILASVVSLLTIISSRISTITSPFASLCSIVSIVLGFFGLKFLFNEKSEKFIKKYVLIQIIYYACYIVIGLLGIYIY